MDGPRFVDIQTLANNQPLPPFTISIAGFPGTGKTTLALTIAQVMPVFIIETEMRLQYLIHHLSFGQPKFKIMVAQLGNWDDIKGILKSLTEWRMKNDTGSAALIIDSSTDYKNFANDEWHRTSKTYPPTNYAKLYGMMDKPIHEAKESGLSVITTTRMKAHYKNDEWDGESYRPDEFKNQGYKTDAALEFDVQGNLVVTKNSWVDIRDWKKHEINRDLGLPAIIELLTGMKSNPESATTETTDE